MKINGIKKIMEVIVSKRPKCQIIYNFNLEICKKYLEYMKKSIEFDGLDSISIIY